MKNIIRLQSIGLIFLFLCSIKSVAQEKYKYEITGQLENLKKKEWVYFRTGGVYDSIKVKNNRFLFKGTISEPGFAMIAIKNETDIDTDPFKNSRDRINFFIGPGKTEIIFKDSISNFSIQSISHNQYVELQTKDEEIQKDVNKLWQEVADFKMNKDLTKELAKRKETEARYLEKLDLVYGNFIKGNPSSPLVIWALNEYAGWQEVNFNRALSLFNSLPEEIKKWPSAEILEDKLLTARNVSIGQLAPNFKLPDMDGKLIQLSDYLGKHVLIEFWASWCGPCRKENPKLVKVYDSFKNNGFEVLGVSLDQKGDKDKWLKAIEQDGLPWIHISDLNAFESPIAKLYGIKALPSNVLIDREGRIIAKNLDGEALNKKLIEQLK